jgi:hypothetical protein
MAASVIIDAVAILCNEFFRMVRSGASRARWCRFNSGEDNQAMLSSGLSLRATATHQGAGFSENGSR